jgi:ATP/maltotriose-dependent transcriptional regulator MalT
VEDTRVTPRTLDPELRITPPRAVPEFALRSELLARLDSSAHQITYVVAPAGFGKTVLASQWIEEGQRAISGVESVGVWIDIDPFESELQFLITAVHAFRLGMGGFAEWFEIESVVHLDSALVDLDRMIDELNRFKKPIRLVIDSADSISASSNSVVDRFLARLPKSVSIMVLRERSPIQSSLGRASLANFNVITAEELRLNEDEVIAMMPGAPDPLKVKRILELTDGWPAATRLILENINKLDFESTEVQPASITSISSVTRRALARLDERELLTLKSLVFVDRISNPVAMSITGDELAPMVLAKLSAESFFLTRVISTPSLYEMNHLIRDVLRDDLALDLDAYAQVHTKTFEALFALGPKYQAFTFLAKTGNPERIRALVADTQVMSDVTQQIREAIYQGDITALQSWSTVIPFLEGTSRSLSFAINFYQELIAGNLPEAKALVVERLLAPKLGEDGDRIQNSSHRLQAIIDCIQGDLNSSIKSTLQAMKELNNSKSTNRLSSFSSFLRFGMTAALFNEDYEAMKRIEEFVENELEPDPSSHFHMNALAIKAIRNYYEGRYRLAESFAFAAISYAKQHNIRGYFIPFDSYFVLFQILMEQCKCEEADQLYQEVISEIKHLKFLPWMIQFQARHAIMLMRITKYNEGLVDFQDLTSCLPTTRSTEVDQMIDRHEMMIQHFVDGEIRREEIRKRLSGGQTAKLYDAQAKLRRNQKDFEKSLAKFDMSLPREALNAHVFQVIQNFEYPPKAREHLVKALEVAQEHGFYQYLLIQGDRFLSFLISSSTEIPSLFLERLSKDASERLRQKLTSSDSLPIPLTKREADILRHLASELPLSKISSDLNITKNTMKTHLRHLYRKLGATDRRDAVEKGKALLNL